MNDDDDVTLWDPKLVGPCVFFFFLFYLNQKKNECQAIYVWNPAKYGLILIKFSVGILLSCMSLGRKVAEKLDFAGTSMLLLYVFL